MGGAQPLYHGEGALFVALDAPFRGAQSLPAGRRGAAPLARAVLPKVQGPDDAKVAGAQSEEHHLEEAVAVTVLSAAGAICTVPGHGAHHFTVSEERRREETR